MKNPDNKPLQIVYTRLPSQRNFSDAQYGLMLSNLAIAESNLVKAGKDSAMPHFVAIVKELESLCGFEFKIMEEE